LSLEAPTITIDVIKS